MSCQTSSDCVAVVPVIICLEVVQGTDTTLEVILTDEKCEPVNITSDDVNFKVKDKIGGTVKLTKTNVAGAHVDGPNGKTRFTIAKTDITDTLTDAKTKWVYEVRRIQAGGDEAVHITGDFFVHIGI